MQELERLRVGVVQILEDDDGTVLLGRGQQEPKDALHHQQPHLAGG